MKFYTPKLNFGGVPTMSGVTLGNSTHHNTSYSPIMRAGIVKIDDEGRVFNEYGAIIHKAVGVPRITHSQLIVTEAEVARYFDEIEAPPPVVASNIKFVVGSVDYENFYEVAYFDDHMEAIRECIRLNGFNVNDYHEVRIEFDTDR